MAYLVWKSYYKEGKQVLQLGVPFNTRQERKVRAARCQFPHVKSGIPLGANPFGDGPLGHEEEAHVLTKSP
jgi:hypothetical protein